MDRAAAVARLRDISDRLQDISDRCAVLQVELAELSAEHTQLRKRFRLRKTEAVEQQQLEEPQRQQ